MVLCNARSVLICFIYDHIYRIKISNSKAIFTITRYHRIISYISHKNIKFRCNFYNYYSKLTMNNAGAKLTSIFTIICSFLICFDNATQKHDLILFFFKILAQVDRDVSQRSRNWEKQCHAPALISLWKAVGRRNVPENAFTKSSDGVLLN